MPHNPYAPPTVPVDGIEEKTAFDFSATAEYSFTPKQLRWAGICCVFGVVLTPIYFALVYFEQSIPALHLASIATLYAMVALSIYVYLVFKKLLHEKSGYRAANLAISLYILASIISALSAPFNSAAEISLFYTMRSIGALVLFGGLAIYLGIKLLRCADNLFGQSKPIAYRTLAMGIATASVLLLFGFLLSIALGIAIAVLFFRASTARTAVQA